MTKLLKNGKPKGKKEKVFDLVLVDMHASYNMEQIVSVKRNMYNSNLKYIAISYRWGELPEELIETPDYTALIKSFKSSHLLHFCDWIMEDPDLKGIQYLWIDVISVDQQNKVGKQGTILKMRQIYEMAAYILAIPDLHYEHLYKNTANSEMMDLIYKHSEVIHQDIYDSTTNDDSDDYYSDDSNIYYNDDSDDSDDIFTRQYSNNHNDSDNEYYSIIQKLKAKNRMGENNEIIMKIKELIKENDELKKEKEIERNQLKQKKDELKKAYQFLAYLIDDWSNRVWVISEYQIAKEKYEKHGTPLKYTFLSLLWNQTAYGIIRPFFSYTFDGQSGCKDLGVDKSTPLEYSNVNNSSKFISYLKSRLVQQSFIDMMVASNASRNEDRFYAVLPSWNKYKHLTKNRKTISSWKITNMLSVKLKLYELMEDNDGDLWDKARLLYYSSIYDTAPVLPSFATYQQSNLSINEIDKTDYASEWALSCIPDYEKEQGPIFKQNLRSIQFNKQERYLSINVDKCFIFATDPSTAPWSPYELLKYSLVDNDIDRLLLVYIPYFTLDIPDENHRLPIYENSRPRLSGTLLLGNKNRNRWILYRLQVCGDFKRPSLCSYKEYTFNVY
ncbi:unnamed protein product [Cunninghamella blakesleeana]